MSKYSAIKVGLDKPPIGDKTIFYASMDGTIQPEVGALPSWIHDSGISFIEGAYGLQARGAMVYPISGLDLEKPFTYAYTYNVFDDSFVGQWSGIIMLTLRGKDSSNNKKVFVSITTDGVPSGSEVQGVIIDCLKDRPYIGGDRRYWSEFNKYRRITITSDGKFVECYMDGILLKRLSLAENPLSDEYKGAPDMQLNINWGHNKNGAQKYGISEVLIAQEYLPPTHLKAYPLENKDVIILPKKSYLGTISQCEIKETLSVTLPATWKIGNNFVNNYVYGSDLQNVCQKGLPNVKIKDRNNGLTWANNDKIIMDGVLGENILATPIIMVEGTEIAITGNWSGIGTNSATFTITNIPEEHQSKALVVKYSISKPKLEKPIIYKCIDSAVGIKYNNKLILPEINLDSKQEVCFKVDNSEDIAVEFNPYTFTLKSNLVEPYELLVLLNEVNPKIAYSNDVEFVAKQNCFITVSALNLKLSKYPKFLSYLLNSDEVTSAMKSAISFSSDGVPMRINGVSNIFSTQSIASKLCYKETNTIIPVEGVDFGNISENNVKPVFLRPILGKLSRSGEIVFVVRLTSSKSAGQYFDSNNTNYQTTCYIPTGIFEK